MTQVERHAIEVAAKTYHEERRRLTDASAEAAIARERFELAERCLKNLLWDSDSCSADDGFLWGDVAFILIPDDDFDAAKLRMVNLV